jgi:hypothetical protein
MPSSDTSSILYRIGQSVTNKIADEAETAGGWQEIKTGATTVSGTGTTYVSLINGGAAPNDVVAIELNTSSVGYTSQIHVVSLNTNYSFSNYGSIMYCNGLVVPLRLVSLGLGIFIMVPPPNTTIRFTLVKFGN